MEFETRAIHAGQAPDPSTGATTVPIYQTSTYVQDAVGGHKGYDYARIGNPTRTALEECLASLQGATYGLAFALRPRRGEAIMPLLSPGDRVVSVNDVYGGIYRIFSQVYEPQGYAFTFLSVAEIATDLAEHLDERTRLLWLETPTNPLLNLVDIQAAATPRAPPARSRRRQYLRHARTSSSRSPSAPTSSCTPPPSTSAGTPTSSAAVATNDDGLSERLEFLQTARRRPRPVRLLARPAGAEDPRPPDAPLPRMPPRSPPIPDAPARRAGLSPASLPPRSRRSPRSRCAIRRHGLAVPGSEHEAARPWRAPDLDARGEPRRGREHHRAAAVMTHARRQRRRSRSPGNLIRLSVGIEDAEDLIEDLDQALA